MQTGAGWQFREWMTDHDSISMTQRCELQAISSKHQQPDEESTRLTSTSACFECIVKQWAAEVYLAHQATQAAAYEPALGFRILQLPRDLSSKGSSALRMGA